MASISFLKNDQLFDLRSPLVTFSGSTVEAANATAFSWRGTHDLDIAGTGFKFENNDEPTNGTAKEIKLDLNNDDFQAPELAITDLYLNMARLKPMTDGSLSSEQQNNLFWRVALDGSDSINFGNGATNGNYSIWFAGDGRTAEAGEDFQAVKDFFSGSFGSGQIAGDVLSISKSAAVIGGSDTFAVSGKGVAAGDAVSVAGFLHGGDDLMQVNGLNYETGVAGDAQDLFVGGTVEGGDDHINLNGNAKYASGDVTYNSGSLIGGDDIIDGGDTAENLYGDTYSVSDGGYLKGGNDVVRGGGSDDFIWGDWRFNSAEAHGGNDKLYGEAGKDTIYGNGGNDLIDGGIGADTMTGELGDDTYYVDNLGDKVIEADETGYDEINSSVTYSLTGQHVEFLDLIGSADSDATGNTKANKLYGNGGDNKLDGGKGNDTLAGGDGEDTFYFTSTLNSSSNFDTIVKYNVADDTIALKKSLFAELGSGVSQAELAINTTGKATTDDQNLIYNKNTGQLYYDSNGDDAGGSVLFAVLDKNLALNTADFMMVV